MRKLLSIVGVCLLLTGCGVSKQDYEALVQENQQLQAQISNAEKLPDVKITGGIVATLHGLLEDPFAGDGVPRYALIQYFQSGLTLVGIEPEIAPELEIGKNYYFEIAPYTVRNSRYQFTLEQIKQLAHDGQWLRIAGYREPNEDEIGILREEILFFEELN